MTTNYYTYLLLLLSLTLLTQSCIKDEEQDTNADILEAYIPNEYLKTEPIITNTSVEFKVKSNINLSNQSPFFIVSPHAKLSPPNGTSRDFTKAQEVYVTAQDEHWVKKYTITFTTDELSTFYSFDKANLVDKKRYYEFFEIDSNGNEIKNWASGNQGYATIAGSLPPTSFPTTITLGNKYEQAARLQTVYTSKSGQLMGNPIAAGNLFLGSFKLSMIAPIKSTKFGLPYDKSLGIPTTLRGIFKYKAGEVVTNSNYEVVPNAVDTFDIYAIIFEARSKNNFLSGDHNFEDPRNIAIARIDEKQRLETTSWKGFEIPFVILEGKTIENNKEYMLAIVMTSSIDGATFTGAVGSTLDIDEVELVFDKN